VSHASLDASAFDTTIHLVQWSLSMCFDLYILTTGTADMALLLHRFLSAFGFLLACHNFVLMSDCQFLSQLPVAF
jgi:hypothetical protein